MTSNGHRKLVDNRWIRKYPCSFCHGATVRAKSQGTNLPPIDDENKLIIYSGAHVNGGKDIRINSFWNIPGVNKRYSTASYDPVTKVCSNLYCHSDGTGNPDPVKPFPWNQRGSNCNSCHGHPLGGCKGCHDGAKEFLISNVPTVLVPYSTWKPGEEWKSAMPMYANEGVGKPRANSHPRHLQTNFSCIDCHQKTIATGGDCGNTICHSGLGTMSEASHLVAEFHVNKKKDVNFNRGGSYDYSARTCSGTACHSGVAPVWGSSINTSVMCFTCHTINDGDTDIYSFKGYTQAKINMTQWKVNGHGRSGTPYPSGNPAANFPNPTSTPPGNPCWYCHDNNVLHKDSSNPFRLKLHQQFDNRFEKECVYCHMTRTNAECLSCHNITGTLNPSMAPQLANITGNRLRTWANRTTIVNRPPHNGFSGTSCLTNQATPCHPSDVWTHNTGSDITWSNTQKADVKNQYKMMGVCLQCHDDDSNNKCAGCHGVKNASGNLVYTDATFTNISIPKKYKLGYDPGTGYIKPQKAKASSAHFGHKHYQGFLKSGGWLNMTGAAQGKWKGGKFCWDCHDPHGDSNIYMIHDKVTTESDGKFGIPTKKVNGTYNQSLVYFRQTVTGLDYALTSKRSGATTVDGICNVCHASGHYYNPTSGSISGDGHNSGTACTKCHEHRFTDSHADGQSCNSCHQNKPVPRHSAFGLPVDCTKCHVGVLFSRADVLGQFRGQSHHVQGVTVTNKVCYQCHWEATSAGTVDSDYHEGYSFKTYTSQKGKKVDLVIYGSGVRPTTYRTVSSAVGRATAVQFVSANMSSQYINTERREAAKVTNHCLGCHSDQNNLIKPFGDCKTPRQYAWDRQSIAARYSNQNVTKWGKYDPSVFPNVNVKYRVTKALSAHGNAANNQGGWDPNTGTDSNINNSRGGFSGMSSVRQNVQCFDCHNSHGSKAGGITSSYLSYSGTRGGNLKETSRGVAGYKVKYAPAAGGTSTFNSTIINPYNEGAGLCFDCHMTAVKAASGNGTPWGYQSTFGASLPIKSYRDGWRFGDRNYTDPTVGAVYKLGGGVNSFTFKQNKNIQGGHMHKTSAMSTTPADSINGLCTPCHDPHGVSPTLGANRQYGVPMLKGTWLSSPYKDDFPPPDPTNADTASHPSPTTGSNRAWGTAHFAGNSGQWRNSPNSNTTVNAPPVTYNIDRNTFGTSSSTTGYGRGGSVKRISESDAQFAGLCMICHAKTALMGRYTSNINGTSAYRPNQARWSSVARVHASNKGWGTNKEHSFTCSKCHEPHNSGLPRLMQTSCLDYNHRAGRSSGGEAWVSRKTLSAPYPADGVGIRSYQVWNDQLRGYPIASIYGADTKGQNTYYFGQTYPIPAADTACHITRPTIPAQDMWPHYDSGNSWNDSNDKAPSQWPNSNYWNKVTPW
jgi:predicted CxxxxCH...CXXCH cytochrome family protein